VRRVHGEGCVEEDARALRRSAGAWRAWHIGPEGLLAKGKDGRYLRARKGKDGSWLRARMAAG